ncbi:hypothetical protein E0W69_018360 [Rhizosphaericola mali]|uniref:Exo-1,4-beta-D-glucosaminidase n=2 Tax=Rhizosphaericola mali TaxID=2545455 RepID=A0A5P2G5N6_9BACT|nr:hypothetical protein E0W69_018360 [Rhizosphaericola mali]
MHKVSNFLSGILCLCFLSKTNAQQIQKLTHFYMQSSSQVKQDGILLSSRDCKSSSYWFPVNVPSTVLKGLVDNHIYPNPYIGMNNMYIPDASDSFNTKYSLSQYSYLPNEENPWKKPYWYRTSFTLEKASNKTYLLDFKGINYRAEVWVNGEKVADSSQMVGMFAEYEINITKAAHAGQMNYLAVKIYPLDYPGEPDSEQLKALGPFFLNGGPTGDIGKNVTMLSSVGWDWMPPVRDRNMGIWQPVFVKTIGAISLEKPHITTKFENNDTTKALVNAAYTLANHSEKEVNGILEIIISPEKFAGNTIHLTRNFHLDKNQTQELNFSPEKFAQLHISHPKLWWPVGYGNPNLYNITAKVTYDNAISDTNHIQFGIRTVSSTAKLERGVTRRDFYVNGKRVYLVGGAWVPDLLVNRDSMRYEEELQLCKTANVNLVRIWGGGITPPDNFWNIADRLGLLVWSDFWITGDTQGEFKGSSDWPLQGNVFTQNVISTIYRIRNHPSLLVWTGGNEGHARKELYDVMRNNVITLDGTRPFIPSSSGFAHLPKGWQGSYPDNQPSGVYSGGPYAWKKPSDYFWLADTARDWVFKDETGIPSQPPMSTLPKIIPNLTWDTTLPYPLNHTWGYHDAATGAGKYDDYYNKMVQYYGQPSSLNDFSTKMQLMNWVGYQGIFEAAQHKLNENGGVMLWKLNAAFPSVIWQIYDWYLQPNAGFYAMQNACAPIHIQLNPKNSDIEIINKSYENQSFTANVSLIDALGKEIKKQSFSKFNSDSSAVKILGNLSKWMVGKNNLQYVFLQLNDAHGNSISKNVYWLNEQNNYGDIEKLPAPNITITQNKSDVNSFDFTVKNAGSNLAFFLNLQLIADGEEIHSAKWSDNYISLLSGSSENIAVHFKKQSFQKLELEVTDVNGNVTKLELN